MHNISVTKVQYKLSDINPNQHTVNAIISLLRDEYSTMNEYATSKLDNHTNMVVLVKYSSILRSINYFSPISIK